MKVFIIPDIHLKPWMLEKASQILKDRHDIGKIVFLGDFVDDWGQESNLDLYKETLESIEMFLAMHQNSLVCWGNHDMSYVWNRNESGYSPYARDVVLTGLDNIKAVLPKENAAFIHRIDNTLFSHAGLTLSFVRKWFLSSMHMEIDEIIERIKRMDAHKLWIDSSPIWARPQNGTEALYPSAMFQVVGHTPVQKPERFLNLLTLDNFSTYQDGTPVGDEVFCIFDTETGEVASIE